MTKFRLIFLPLFILFFGVLCMSAQTNPSDPNPVVCDDGSVADRYVDGTVCCKGYNGETAATNIDDCCGGSVLPLGDECCGDENTGTNYDPTGATGEGCCGETIYLFNEESCCGDEDTGARFDPMTEECCDDDLVADNSSTVCCDSDGDGQTERGFGDDCCGPDSEGNYTHYETASSAIQCCGGETYDPASATEDCCGDEATGTLYDPTSSTEGCCGSGSSETYYDTASTTNDCCGGQIWDTSLGDYCCGDGIDGQTYDPTGATSNEGCCGQTFYDPSSPNEACCGEAEGAVYDPTQDECCDDIDEIAYGSSNEICCVDPDGSTIIETQTDCCVSYPVSLTGPSSSLCLSDTDTVSASGGTGSYTYTSPDSTIVSVDSSGNVTGVAAGTADITATDDNECSASVTVTVVEVASVADSAGTVNSTTGNAPGSSETLYVPKGNSGATIELVATPNPSGATWPTGEPSWTGATVDPGDASRATFSISSVSSSSSGSVVEVSCGTSVKKIRIVVFEVSADVNQANVCDGEAEDVDIKIDPINTGLEQNISNVSFTVYPDTNIDSPSGQPISVTQKNTQNITQWEILNVRWYATPGSSQCNDIAVYQIDATLDISATNVLNGTNLSIVPALISAEASLTCVNGNYFTGPYFSGSHSVSITAPPSGQTTWTATIASGSNYIRDITATYSLSVTGGTNSQYHSMVEREEIYHVNNQFLNPNHSVLKNYWLASNVNNAVVGKSVTGTSQSDVIAKAKALITTAQNNEINRSSVVFNYPGTIYCNLEAEAKSNISPPSTHKGKMDCAYPLCP